MPQGIVVDDILSKFNNPQLLSDEGGQKIVYTVTLPDHGESILKIGHFDSRAALERIQREVAILRDVESKYFPRNYDFAILDAERFIILEEYLRGTTLTRM